VASETGREIISKGLTGMDAAKFRPITVHKGPEEEERCGFTLSLTFALDGVGEIKARPRPLYSREIDPVPILQEAGWISGSF
jgi:hypothetical protein